MPLRLSVLDFAPLRSDQTTSDAIATSVRQAQLADALGFERYWVSEHHDMPYASTHPGVFISTLAAKTQRIRVGSGGVMVTNHTAFDIAEQFAYLEAAYPSRIDLGIGRAPAGNRAATALLRGGLRSDAAHRFASEVSTITAMLEPGGVKVGEHNTVVKATAAARSTPEVWMLGASPRSASIAAEMGVPYAYAHHFFGTGTAEAVDTYRANFQPSEHTPAPRLLVTMNVVAAATENEAHRLALPNLIHTVDAITGLGERTMKLVEEAEKHGIRSEVADHARQIRAPWILGTGKQVRAQLEAFTKQHGVDELMVQLIAGAHEGTASTWNPAAEETLRLLAPLTV